MSLFTDVEKAVQLDAVKVENWVKNGLKALAGNLVAYAVSHAVAIPSVTGLSSTAIIVVVGGALLTAGLHWVEHQLGITKVRHAKEAIARAEALDAKFAAAVRAEMEKAGYPPRQS